MKDESKKENKKVDAVDKETAREWFENWADDMDLDIDTEDMDDEDLKGFEKQRRRLEKAIMNGSLTFNDEGEAVFMPANEKSKCTDPITFHERTGASVMAMDGKKKNQDARKMYAMMADLTKTSSAVFSRFVGNDIKICETLLILLMD